jgi:hypothetical protein
MDLTGQMLMAKQLMLEKPDVIIRPELGQIGMVDRVDITGLIKSGELVARKLLPELSRAVSWQYRLRQRVARFVSPQSGNEHEP